MLAIGACASSDFTGSAGGTLDDLGLKQYVLLSTPSLAVGDSLSVRSIVINNGSVPAAVTIACGHGLTFSGLAFVSRPDTLPTNDCLVDLELAPGDSLVSTASTPPVAAVPGDYLFTVQQVLSPTWGVRLAVHVVAAGSGTH
jgi:hypothetical protein